MAIRYPKWITSVEELNSFILDAQIRAINKPTTSGSGDGIHIGIIDSVYEIPDHLQTGIKVNEGRRFSCFSNPDEHVNPHGVTVFNQLSAVAPNSEFSVYHAINKDGKLALGPYADAISRAIDAGVDIVNLSAGDPWRGPINLNGNVKETKRLLEAGIPVVAAAGNYEERHDSRPPVHCPSAMDGVTSVGAYVTQCPTDPGEEANSTEGQGPYYLFNDSEDIPHLFHDVYCGENSCIDGKSCIPKQIEKPWDNNPLPTGDKPDVLAPMHIIEGSGKNAYLSGGTSFAAPIVTGSLACIFGELVEMGMDIPSSYEVQRAVSIGASGMRNSQIPKYDAMGVREIFNIT